MSKHKKILTAALCAAMMLSATACNRASNQMAETFIVCDTIADTEEMVGYYTMLPETIEGYDTPCARRLQRGWHRSGSLSG